MSTFRTRTGNWIRNSLRLLLIQSFLNFLVKIKNYSEKGVEYQRNKIIDILVLSITGGEVWP